MSNEFDRLLNRIAGHADWVECTLPPEGNPDFNDLRAIRLTPRWKPTKAHRLLLRKLQAGRPRIEAQGPHTQEYNLVPLETLGFSFRYNKHKRRLVALDRDGQEVGDPYFNPRPVADGKLVPPEEVENIPGDADTPTQGARSEAGAKKLGYGEARPAVLAAIKTYEMELLAKPTRKAKGEFLVGKVNCSLSRVLQILQEEGM